MKTFKLNCEYPACRSFLRKLDSKIETVVGRIRDASGLGFGLRDIAWYGLTRHQAKTAYNRLKARMAELHLKSVDFSEEDN